MPRTTRFCMWSFCKGVLKDSRLSKLIPFEWSQECLSYTGLTLLIFLLAHGKFLGVYLLKVRLSAFKKSSFICFNESLSKKLWKMFSFWEPPPPPPPIIEKGNQDYFVNMWRGGSQERKPIAGRRVRTTFH